MSITTNTNTNIQEINKLVTPYDLKKIYFCTSELIESINHTRDNINSIISNSFNRFIVIVGPCSIHNTDEAYEYALFLKKMISKYGDKLLIVMRTYIAKPRTCLGWKGLMYDPDLNEDYNINKGLIESRRLLLKINLLGVPCGMEYLDTVSPQYFDDLLVWGAIGARTTESQVHRELCSGISTPVGFKNNLDGDTSVAVNSIKCCAQSHVFIGCNSEGKASSVKSKGNPNGHIILRGSHNGPNYDINSIRDTENKLEEQHVNKSIIVDCSHGNSGKDYKKQHLGVEAVIQHLQSGIKSIKGIMLESNLVEGSQKLCKDLKKGVSITDSCIGLEETQNLLEKLYNTI